MADRQQILNQSDDVISSQPITRDHKQQQLRVMVIGKTGSGKSATANTLLGERRFKEGSSAISETAAFQVENVSFNNKASPNHLEGQSPYLTREEVETLQDIGSTDAQWEAANTNAKGRIESSLTNYGHDLSKVKPPEQLVEELIVIDSPGDWNTKVTDKDDHSPVDVYVFVINLASPRFGADDLRQLRSLKGVNGEKMLKSGCCLTVLSHADGTLHHTSLDVYLNEINGDPLHTLLTKDMNGRVMAINNAAESEYEKGLNLQSFLNEVASIKKLNPNKIVGKDLSRQNSEDEGQCCICFYCKKYIMQR